jgi:hypothetical protein
LDSPGETGKESDVRFYPEQVEWASSDRRILENDGRRILLITLVGLRPWETVPQEPIVEIARAFPEPERAVDVWCCPCPIKVS